MTTLTRKKVDKTMTQNKGFTLIELMAVIAIVSILAVIALGAYSDYVVRSKVSEGMVFAAEAKTSVSGYFYNIKTMPQNNTDAGLSLPDEYKKYDYISRLVVGSYSPPDGVITITFRVPGSTADGRLVQLIPATVDGIITWTCEAPTNNGMKANHLPPNCRG